MRTVTAKHWLFVATWVLSVVGVLGKPLYPSPFALPAPHSHPRLLLISGCTGAGKSTLAMSVAVKQGWLRCVSTDTLRLVLRSVFADPTLYPALHRSSYAGEGDEVRAWQQCSAALQPSVQAVVRDSAARRTSLVLEGVHIQPDNELIHSWQALGGEAVGCLLTIEDETLHRDLLLRRGKLAHSAAQEQLRNFHRIRTIQEAMVEYAQSNNWLILKQDGEADPLRRIEDVFRQQAQQV